MTAVVSLNWAEVFGPCVVGKALYTTKALWPRVYIHPVSLINRRNAQWCLLSCLLSIKCSTIYQAVIKFRLLNYAALIYSKVPDVFIRCGSSHCVPLSNYLFFIEQTSAGSGILSFGITLEIFQRNYVI